MTGAQILDRARALADLGQSKFIDQTYALQSLNEAWKDIYAYLLDNDDDYYLTETTLTLNSTVAVAGTTNEYLIPLPTDAMRVRYVDYRGTFDWLPMDKFNLSMKDNKPGDPYYRVKNSSLWIIGGAVPTTGLSVRLGYYPAPSTITAPQSSYYYGTSYTMPNFRGLTAPGWASVNRTMVYVSGTTALKAESQTLNTVSSPVALFTESGTTTNLVYYKGTLFWIRGGAIWSKDTALTAAFVAPNAVVAAASITAFFIVNDLIYYVTNAAIRQCSLTGTADTLIVSVAPTGGIAVIGTMVFYLDPGDGHIHQVGVTDPVSTGWVGGIKLQADSAYLYVLSATYEVHKLTINTAGTATTADATTATDTLLIGQPTLDQSNEAVGIGEVSAYGPLVWVLPLIRKEQQRMYAQDVTTNYDFTFPNNLVSEIMAYRAAVDYRGRQSQDTTALTARLAELWERFRKMVRRDDYKPERIRNVYAESGWTR